jgi:hypothetical protein
VRLVDASVEDGDDNAIPVSVDVSAPTAFTPHAILAADGWRGVPTGAMSFIGMEGATASTS